MATATPPDETVVLSPEDEKRLLWLTVLVIAVLILVLTVVSCLIWDGGSIIIMWVPVHILEWAFAGAMVSVLYRLGYRKDIPPVGLELYTWVIAKPVIGLFLGSLVYFLALAGAKLLDGSPEALKKALWLNVVAFVGGFSDKLSVGLIDRFVRRRLGSDGE